MGKQVELDRDRLDYLQGEIHALRLAVSAILVTHPHRDAALNLAGIVLTENEAVARATNVPEALGIRSVRELMGLR